MSDERIGQDKAQPGSPTDKLALIRELYFKTTPATILRDFDRAIDLLKSMTSETEREKARVYMTGLAEMRKEFRSRRRT